MTFRRACLVFCLWWFALPALAENVRVLSGEHDNFSRIVLIFGQPVHWEPARTEDGFTVQFDRGNLAFDFSKVFDLIPRDRIRSVAYDEKTNQLRLESDCSCSIEVFQAGKATVAIDIASARKPQSDEPVAAIPPAAAAFAPLPRLSLPGLGLSYGAGKDGSGRVGVSLAAGYGVDESGRDQPDRRMDQRTLEEGLLRQLGRAASQGLLDVRLPQTADPRPEAPGRLPGMVPEASHVVSETVFDRVWPDAEATSLGHITGPGSCPAEDLLDPASWRSQPPGEAIAAARRGILDALEVPDRSEVANLVRTYLSLGFGEEAQAVLREFPDGAPESELYRLVADVLEDRPAARPNRLLALQTCKGPSAVWAALASSEPSQLADIDADEVQKWFFRFPANLRLLLGARLVKTLLGAGWTDAAVSVRNSMARSTTVPELDLVLLDATTPISPERSRAAMSRLPELRSTDVSKSADATNVLLSEQIRSDRVDPSTVSRAEALVPENAGTEIGQDLLANIAVARAQLGDFVSALAFHEIWARTGAIGEEVDKTLSGIVERMVRLEDDAALLRFLNATQPSRAASGLSKDVTEDVVERLLDIGLWKAARTMLKKVGPDSEIRHRQLAAEIAQKGGDPKLALAILAGERDPKSLDIKARALQQIGDHGSASAVMQERGDLSGAAREAWLSGQPALIETYGTEPEKDFQSIRASAEENSIGAEGPDLEVATLEHARTLIGRSDEMRQRLAQLLADR